MTSIDRGTYEGLHPSDRLALYFHAVLATADNDARRAQLGRLDAWIAELGPRFDRDQIRPLLTACSGTPLEPMSLKPDARNLAERFVQIVFSDQVGGSRARIVSEDTLGISGGLSFRKDLKAKFIERRGEKGANPATRGDWYFAPAGLRDEKGIKQALSPPLRLTVRPSTEHGFVLAIALLDRESLGWDAETRGLAPARLEPVDLSELARDLESNSTVAEGGAAFESILTRLHSSEEKGSDAELAWVPTGAEAIVRFSALLAGGHTLRLDPGRRYAQRAVATTAFALPHARPVDLDVRLQRSAPRLTIGLWAKLGDGLTAPPWGSLPGAAS